MTISGNIAFGTAMNVYILLSVSDGVHGPGTTLVSGLVTTGPFSLTFTASTFMFTPYIYLSLGQHSTISRNLVDLSLANLRIDTGI